MLKHPEKNFDNGELGLVDYRTPENTLLRKMVYEFAYLNQEATKNISLYTINGSSSFLIVGKDRTQIMVPEESMHKEKS